MPTCAGQAIKAAEIHRKERSGCAAGFLEHMKGERKTEWNENSISGRKKIMSKGEAAEMRMDCFSGHEKPTCGAKDSCWRRMKYEVR